MNAAASSISSMAQMAKAGADAGRRGYRRAPGVYASLSRFPWWDEYAVARMAGAAVPVVRQRPWTSSCPPMRRS